MSKKTNIFHAAFRRARRAAIAVARADQRASWRAGRGFFVDYQHARPVGTCDGRTAVASDYNCWSDGLDCPSRGQYVAALRAVCRETGKSPLAEQAQRLAVAAVVHARYCDVNAGDVARADDVFEARHIGARTSMRASKIGARIGVRTCAQSRAGNPAGAPTSMEIVKK